MTQAHDIYAIQTLPQPKRVVRPLNGGAHRGASQNSGAFADINRDSTSVVIEPTYVDPVPGRAAMLQQLLSGGRVLARAIEGRIEDIVLAEPQDSTAPIVLNIDRASGVARVLRTTANSDRPTLGYMLVKLPSNRLLGLRFALEAANDQESAPGQARAAAVAFFERLADVSERNSSEDIFGENTDPSHAMLEPRIREWFAEHTKKNLSKLIAGIEPVSNTFELTNGFETMPMIISVQNDWAPPLALAEEIAQDPPMPIRRGMQFVVAEVGRDGIRFHDVRRRTDDRVTVGGTDVIDTASVDAAFEERKRRIAEALARAEREMLSRRNPVMTTD